METLLTYLRETRTTPKAFAQIIGVDQALLERMLSGDAAVDVETARRMIDATGGALQLGDLVEASRASGTVCDLRARLASAAAEIDAGRLAEILGPLLCSLTGGGRRKGDDRLPALAAEAAANTYAALSTVTSREGEERLAQALRPVFAEILAELSARPASRAIDLTAREAAGLYFRVLKEKRRA